MEHYTTPHEASSSPLMTAHIVMTPGVCGGKPRIAGHRIRVQDITIWHEQQGCTPEEIVTMYPQLSLAQVHAALAYYFDHRDEIQEHIHEADVLVQAMRNTDPSTLSARHDPSPPLSPG